MAEEKPDVLTQAMVETDAPGDDGNAPAKEVSLDTKAPVTPDLDQVTSKIKEDFEKLYGGRFKQLEDRLNGAQRINHKLEQEVAQLRRPATPAPVVTEGQEKPLTRQEVLSLLRQEEQLKDFRHQAETQERVMQESKQVVIEKYPDLDPESGNPKSKIAQTYDQVLSEFEARDPRFLSNPYGPRIVLQATEERLKDEALKDKGAKGNGHGLPPSRPLASPGKVVLTKDQVALCDRMGIDYADYAKTQQLLEAGEGVS